MIGSKRSVQALVIAGVVATAGLATLGGQAERASNSELKALVDEVRALRRSIERTPTHASQAQLLLGRVQLQENRLATLGRQYQDARARSLDAQMATAQSEARLQHMTELLRHRWSDFNQRLEALERSLGRSGISPP